MATVHTATPRFSIRQRRLIAAALTIICAGAWAWGAYRIDVSLGHTSIYTGVSLLACLLSLMLLGMRRKLVMLPVLPVKTWVEIHIYTAVFSLAVYVLHVPAIVATGRLEGPLSWLFLVVSASGFYGLWLSRTAPKRLSQTALQPRYDRIDWHRDQIAQAAHTVVESLDSSPDRQVLQSLYEKRLKPYFQSGLSLAYAVIPSGMRKRRLTQAIVNQHRYFDGATLSAANRLSSLVRQRDDLDYQHAIQFRLRAWVTLHSALAFVLLIWASVHGVLAWGMLGS